MCGMMLDTEEDGAVYRAGGRDSRCQADPGSAFLVAGFSRKLGPQKLILLISLGKAQRVHASNISNWKPIIKYSGR